MDRISLVRADPMESTMSKGCESIPAGSDTGNSEEGHQRPSNTSTGKVKGGNGQVPFSVPDGDLTEYLRKEITTITANSVGELEDVWAEVGFHKSKIPVFEKMLSAVRVACDESVRQAKEERDDLISQLEQEKSKILDLSRKLGAPVPDEGESTEEFFYGKGQLKTLLDRLATLELTHQNLRAQYKDRSRNVDILIEEMTRINECMDREPEEGEFENSGGAEWEGKEGWELSGERVVKLRQRLSKLQALKAERASEMVELVVDCQKLFRQLGLEVTNPLHSKMLMSLDPSTPEDQPMLRTDEQTQTSVGLSAINVRRLRKMREEMQEELDIHKTQKEEHMRQINVLWNKLCVPQRRREEHIEATKGLTQAVMDKLEAELARLRKLKGKKLTSMMKSAREDIQKLLEAVGAKAEEVLGERARDLSVPPDSWTEELLDRHEEMLSKLEALEKAVSPIMERVRKREDLVLKRERVDSFKMDYRLRGTKFVTQTKEVDDMKKELKRLPQLTADLRKRLTDWQEAEGFPIRYNGREYLKVIEESNMQWQHRKEVNKRSRNASGKGPGLRINHHATASKVGEVVATAAAGAGSRLTGVGGGGEGGKVSATVKASPSSPRQTKNPLISSFPPSPSRLRHIKLGTFASTGGSQIGNNMTVSQAGEDVGAAAAAAGAGSKLTVAAGALGTSGAAIVDGRGEDDKVSVSSNAPPSPKREARNPLLSSFTPSPSRQRHKALAGVFASTGGSHRRQPPPLPARPATTKTSPALGKMQSSPNLLRAATASAGGHGNATAAEESSVSSVETAQSKSGLQEPAVAAKNSNVSSVLAAAPSSGAGSMPPPLPARPARPSSAVFDRADLQAIRESTASSLRSSVSESDLLSGTRLTETSR